MAGKTQLGSIAETIASGLKTPGTSHVDTEDDLPGLLRLLWHLRALQLQAECIEFAYQTGVIAAANLGYLGHDEKSLMTGIVDLEERIISVRRAMLAAGGRAAVLRFLSIADHVALQSSQAQSIWHIKPRRYLGAVPTVSTTPRY